MIKVGVVDDHRLVRKSFCALINSFKGIRVVLEAENGKVLLDDLKRDGAVDILLLDLRMPVMDGFETCRSLSDLYPSIKILIVSQMISKESIAKAIDMGAHGFFSKDADPGHLEIALRSIHDTGFYFEPGISSTLHEIIVNEKARKLKPDPFAALSAKEIQLISLVCNGYRSDEIADLLSINIRTVESYRKKILDKTEARNFTMVVLMAIKHHYVSLDKILTKAI